MKFILQQYKGDITLFVTIIVSAVMLILLLALSQKITVESRISRENLYSQQAIQAANTGIDAWEYRLAQTGDVTLTTSPTGSIINGPLQNWPNSNITGKTITDSSGKEWIELSSVGGSSIQYRVEFQVGNPAAIPPTKPLIISKGRVVRDNTIIERTLEQDFQTIATPTPPLYVGPPVPIGVTTHSFNNTTDQDISLTWTSGIINVISESKTAPDGIDSTGNEAKHYTITLPPTNNYNNLVVTAQSTAAGDFDPNITIARLEKFSPTVWKVWFKRSSGVNTYVGRFTITGE
jgi:hypothetical protein